MTDAITEAQAALEEALGLARYRGADALDALPLARKLALVVHDACAEASTCNERPERFFDPCVHNEGIEPGTRGTRICRLAIRERLLAPGEARHRAP